MLASCLKQFTNLLVGMHSLIKAGFDALCDLHQLAARTLYALIKSGLIFRQFLIKSSRLNNRAAQYIFEQIVAAAVLANLLAAWGGVIAARATGLSETDSPFVTRPLALLPGRS